MIPIATEAKQQQWLLDFLYYQYLYPHNLLLLEGSNKKQKQ